MQGLAKEIDWVDLTFQHRVLESGVAYRQSREEWQKEIDEGIAKYKRVYLQLPRGHDKTYRYAWWANLWLLSTTSAKGYCVGVDRDNAKLFRDAARTLCQTHPDLFDDIEVEKHIVKCRKTGSEIETISSDVNSAYGLNFDLLIINDFHAWPDEGFWEVLWTACEKKPGIRVWLESNALTLGTAGATWVSRFRKWVAETGSKRILEGEENPEWFYYNPPRHLASWQKDKIKDWEQTLHPAVFKRLIENRDGSGDESFLTLEQVEAIEKGRQPRAERGITVTALDLGLTKDAACICTVQSLPRPFLYIEGKKVVQPPKLVLLGMDVLVGSKDDPVLLESAENLVLHHRSEYKSSKVLADPWQVKYMIQRYHWMEEFTFTAANIKALTTILYRCVADKTLDIYKDAGQARQKDEEWNLKRELTEAVVKEMSYGQRVDHRSGGFSDRLIALGMCCHELMGGLIPKKDEHAMKVVIDPLDPGVIISGWMRDLGKSAVPQVLRFGGK